VAFAWASAGVKPTNFGTVTSLPCTAKCMVARAESMATIKRIVASESRRNNLRTCFLRIKCDSSMRIVALDFVHMRLSA